MSNSLPIIDRLKYVVKKQNHPNGAIVWQHPTKPQYKIVVVEERKQLKLRYQSPTTTKTSQALMSYLSSGSRIAWGKRLGSGNRKSGYTVLPLTQIRYQKFADEIKGAL